MNRLASVVRANRLASIAVVVGLVVAAWLEWGPR